MKTVNLKLWIPAIIFILTVLLILEIVYGEIKLLIAGFFISTSLGFFLSTLISSSKLSFLSKQISQLMKNLSETEQSLIKQKNLYALLSATNQLLIRAQSSQQLFDEICLIAIKKPNLLLAWIGLVDSNTQRIDIVAKAGLRLDYLDTVFISLNADLPEGQGPTATAIREKRCVITNHFQTSQLTTPWHHAAHKARIQSSAVFPIYQDNQAIGAFNLYSDLLNYFTEEVISLLTEMSSDMSFALEKLAQDKLRQQTEERFRDVIQASGAYIWELDKQFRYCYLTEQVESIKGYTIAQLLGNSLLDYIPKSEIDFVTQTLQKAILNKGNFELIHQNITSEGDILWEEIKGQAVLNEQGEVIKLRGAGISLTAHKQAQARIMQLAYYDELTGLPNRRLFLDRLADDFLASKRSGKFSALLCLDLDHFKHLNDSLGHDIGDLLLIQITKRLAYQLHEEDIIARLGGDEFVILLRHLSHSLETAINLAQKITENILTDLREPYRLKEHDYHSYVSIGVTLFPLPEQELANIINQADTALYRAKAMGRNTFQFYRSEMQEMANQRLKMEKNLRMAINDQQFQLYFQPQINDKNKMIGAEVLLRWISPDLGFISPDQFIPIAEELGLIIEMGYWVFQQTFQQINRWLVEGLLTTDQHISINVSSKQFKEVDFFYRISQLVKQTEVNASVIILELTESVFLERVDEMIEKMLQLRSLGFRFSIDDFGTGYSSLAYLKLLPLNELKIDKAFVDDIEDDLNDKVIVETIIAMAQHLQLSVIAEGVETLAQLELLKKQGCLNYQGYYFSKPLNKNDFEVYVRQSRELV